MTRASGNADSLGHFGTSQLASQPRLSVDGALAHRIARRSFSPDAAIATWKHKHDRLVRAAKPARPRRERRNVRRAPSVARRTLSLQTHRQTAAFRNLHALVPNSFSNSRAMGVASTLAIQVWKLPAQRLELGQVVEDDVRLVQMLRHVVLVIGLGDIELL